ncbi:MAG TPA: MFS transporter [Candidatus Limnocylindria bacterium]|nr:MFS transporter [Candidatus Limnocylindria bacterium]
MSAAPGHRGAPAIATALVVSASLLGDTLLYTVLPVSAASLGISRPVVGVILSLNRWVRLITNPVAARLYGRFPAGALVVVAIVLSAVSTAMYALPAALVVFFLGRLLWGFCYSLLRLGSFLAALEDAASHAGRRIGNTRAIWGVGYFAGAVFAPFAIESIGWTGACLVAAALTLVAGIGPAYLAGSWRRHVRVPEEGHTPASVWEPRLLALFATATVQLGLYAGILVAAGGFRVDELFHEGAPIVGFVVPATFVAAAFALTQRVAQVLWTPIAGRWSDRSASWAFVISTLVALTSVALLAVLRLDPILFVVIGGCAFVNGLTTTIAVELVVSRRSRDHDRPRILAALHTWQDAGAAGGALLGGVLAAVGAGPALLAGAALLGLTIPLWWAAMRPR